MFAVLFRRRSTYTHGLQARSGPAAWPKKDTHTLDFDVTLGPLSVCRDHRQKRFNML